MERLYETVQSFLVRFKTKAKAYGIRFRIDRTKNLVALDELGINVAERESIVMSLEVEDYYRGPYINETNNDGNLWTFGRKIKKKEAYIKLAEGETDNSPVCVSFHPAEYEMDYPLKRLKNKKKGGKPNE